VSGQRGYALLLALFALLTAELAALIAAASLAVHFREVRHESETIRLTAITDAAVAETLAELARSPAHRGLSRRPFAGGWIESRVETRGGRGGRFRLEIEAGLGHRERRVVVYAVRTGGVLRVAAVGLGGAEPSSRASPDARFGRAD
jgi:hypothetical protein